MSKITITAQDGTVSEISDDQYNELVQKSVSAIISTPDFETRLNAVFGKFGEAVLLRLTEVEKNVKSQGEKIATLEGRVNSQEEKVRENSNRSRTLEDEMVKLRKELERVEKEKNHELGVLRRKVDRIEGKPASVLDKCADPGNLQAEFKQLLQVKRNNKKQLIFGPVFSKTPGDGHLDKDNLEPLDESEIAEAIKATRTEGVFTVTVTNAEKRMAKVRFEGESAVACCENIIASWRLLRDEFSMWAGPDQPVDLAKMEANAKKFGIALRADAKLPPNSYVTVTDGVLFVGAVRVVPVYMIPEPAKWPLINHVVAAEIKSFLSLPWTARKVRASAFDISTKVWDAIWKDPQQDGDGDSMNS
jgi:hypothetical protein